MTNPTSPSPHENTNAFVAGRVSGLYIAWSWRYQSKSQFLATNRTQKGQTQRVFEKGHREAGPGWLSCSYQLNLLDLRKSIG